VCGNQLEPNFIPPLSLVVCAGETLRAQLTQLINPHTVLSYTDVWAALDQIDQIDSHSTAYCPVGQINDIYSAKCWAFPGGQCGNYQKEGDCYNREHSFPKSWWNGSVIPSYTDLFHLYPSDGYRIPKFIFSFPSMRPPF
jgi:hypothetical protein